MIKQIKRRPRIDQLKNDVRSRSVKPRNYGRLIYFGMLIGFFLVLLNHFFGSAIFLRADGMVLKKRQVIAALYPARVTKIFVREGEQVKKGEPLVEIQSSEILRQLADVSARNADLTARVSQLKSRSKALEALVPLAREHANQANSTMESIQRLKKGALATSASVGRAYADRFSTLSRLAELEAEASSLNSELKLVEIAQGDAENALQRLKIFYNRGLITSPIDGTVGPHLPSPGDVQNIAEDILSLYTGRPFLLAYLPDHYLFAVRPGQLVRVVSGATRITATVAEILPVADALPAEFQNIFKPRERSRLLRIALPDNHSFAVSQKVSVRGALPPISVHRSAALLGSNPLWPVSFFQQ